MKTMIQRVNYARVEVEGEISGEIGPGLLILTGIAEDDTEEKAIYAAKKISEMRIFPGEKTSKFDRSLIDIKGEILLVSQFTLFADTKKGRRPDFFKAARPEVAVPLFDFFVERFKQIEISKVATGIFGAHMKVSLENDGPVTIPFDC